MVMGAVHAYYLTGYVAGAGLFQKFYFGGQTRAEFLAKRHNYEVSSRFNQRIREFVLQL